MVGVVCLACTKPLFATGLSAWLTIAAREYAEKIARADGDPEKMPPRSLSLEPLVEAVVAEARDAGALLLRRRGRGDVYVGGVARELGAAWVRRCGQMRGVCPNLVSTSSRRVFPGGISYPTL